MENNTTEIVLNIFFGGFLFLHILAIIMCVIGSISPRFCLRFTRPVRDFIGVKAPENDYIYLRQFRKTSLINLIILIMLMSLRIR